eukprot:6483890-Amphidinium_carterae.1
MLLRSKDLSIGSRVSSLSKAALSIRTSMDHGKLVLSHSSGSWDCIRERLKSSQLGFEWDQER